MIGTVTGLVNGLEMVLLDHQDSIIESYLANGYSILHGFDQGLFDQDDEKFMNLLLQWVESVQHYLSQYQY